MLKQVQEEFVDKVENISIHFSFIETYVFLLKNLSLQSIWNGLK